MIRVNDDYVIEVDTLCYVANRDTHKTRIDKTTGKEIPVYNLVGYFGTLETAIKGIIHHIIQNKLSVGTHDIKGAIEIIRTEMKQFDELLEKALE